VRRFPWREVPVYLAAQFSGALLAALLNWLVFGDQARRILALGSTHPGPGKSWWIALVTELVLTLVLMVVVMATAVFEKAPGGSAQAGLSIGFWIGAAVFLALPVSGGSLNPARTLGPDIISLSFSCWWTYLVGPVVGAILGGLLWEHVLSKGDKHAVESAADSNPRTQSDLE
jgi:glycerol uptake facilitator-like aquaporin